MFQIRLPITVLKIAYGVAVITENGSWAAKHASKVGEKISWVAENVSYYSKKAAENIKSFNTWVEEKAREYKEDYRRAIAIRESEYRRDYYITSTDYNSMPGAWRDPNAQQSTLNQSSLLGGEEWTDINLNAA